MRGRFLLGLLLSAVLLTVCGCVRPLKTDAPMTSFSFSHSGMHSGLIYTLSAEKDGDGWRADLSLLAGDREYELDMTEEEAEALNALVETHKLTGWNGFDKVDRLALDGTDFELRIGYEDGQEVCASGSNAFPKGYREAREAILELFGEMMERNGMENPF